MWPPAVLENAIWIEASLDLQRVEDDYITSAYNGKYEPRNPPRKWKGYLERILRHRSHGRLLDVGCAWGLFLVQAQAHFECAGTDVSEAALEHARRRLPTSTPLFRGNLGELPEDEAYDVVTCFDVVEHCAELARVWQNLWNLLKPGGILALTIPVYDGPLGSVVNLLDKDRTHVHRRERAFWIGQVQGRFRILEYDGIWRYFFFDRCYLSIVSSRSRSIATAIMLVCERQ